MIEDAYLAGLIDGEGHISIVHRPRRDRGRKDEFTSYACVAFTMCDREPLDAIAQRFGGTVIPLKRADSRWRRPYRWQSGGPGAEALLRAAYPYLLVKKEHARIALEFRETLIQGGRTTPVRAKMNQEVHDRRLELRERLRALNMRGSQQLRATA